MRFSRVFCGTLLVIGAADAALACTPIFADDAKLIAGDPGINDFFGFHVAIDGDTIAVGHTKASVGMYTSAGAVYVYVLDGGTWTQQAKLIANDPEAVSALGIDVAISGDTLVAGASSSEAYVFVRSGTTWSQQAKLAASDETQNFGRDVAISGDRILIGASADDQGGGNAGAVYVFQRSGTSWTEQTKLLAWDATNGDYFGSAVRLDGDTAIISAPGDDVGVFPDVGSAYIWVYNGTGWTQQEKLTVSSGETADWVGSEVDVSGDFAVVGASGDDDAGDEAGAAYIFQRIGTNWTEQTKLIASDTQAGDHFGESVAISGNRIVIGAADNVRSNGFWSGAAYVFVNDGTGWFEAFKLESSDVQYEDDFGKAVAIQGTRVVVGATRDDHSGLVDAGSAYVFEVPGSGPPTALCKNVTAEADASCTANASIDDCSFDPDQAVTLTQAPPGPYPLGNTLVMLTAINTGAESDSCTATVTVEDVMPPQVTANVATMMLWPPFHQMMDVDATVGANDDCGAVTLELSLTSDEPDDAPGGSDGATTGDIEPGVDDFHFRMRAERDANGSGRTYTATYTATDASGNMADAAATIVVPYDQGGVVDPISLVLVEEMNGRIEVQWSAAPGAVSYDVIRALRSNLTETLDAYDLGPVVCIEDDSTDTTTNHDEDSEEPPTGETFLYLVSWNAGLDSTYGSESAHKPRVVGSGDCP